MNPNGSGLTRFHDYWGYEVDLSREVAKYLNLDLSIVSPTDNEWGAAEKVNGSWTGMVQLVSDEKADAVFSDLAISFMRFQV